jgi:tetratricopeptide (TPR) repeat protein
MRLSSPTFVLLTVLCVSTAASAQTTSIGGLPAPGGRYTGGGDFAPPLALCAHDDPGISIPSCTKLLNGPLYPRSDRLDVLTLRARSYVSLGDFDRALADYEQAIVVDGGAFWIHANRGYVYFLAGDYKDALLSYDAAVALNPDDAALLVNRALLLAAAPVEDLRDSLQSLADAQRANELEPEQPAYIDALAVAFASNGEFDRAALEQQRAIGLLPPDNQTLIDDYRSRLHLYQQRMPFVIAPDPGE